MEKIQIVFVNDHDKFEDIVKEDDDEINKRLGIVGIFMVCDNLFSMKKVKFGLYSASGILVSKNHPFDNKILQFALHEETTKHNCDPKRCGVKCLGVWSTKR